MSTSHFKWEPAVWTQGANLVIAALVAFHILTGTTGGAIGTVIAGALALIGAILTRPWVVAAFGGAAQTVVTGITLLGWHLTDPQQGIIITLTTFLVGLLIRYHVTPAAKTEPKVAA